MQILKNTKFAAAAMAAVCVLSMFIGTNKSLAALSNKTEALFYSGVRSSEGYTQPSIASQLEACSVAALGLVTFARNYPELSGSADALAGARAGLYEAGTISEISAANELLKKAFADLNNAIAGTPLNERDAAAASAYASDFNSAQTFISSLADGYNGRVTDYGKAARSFPAALFGWFAGAPDKF